MSNIEEIQKVETEAKAIVADAKKEGDRLLALAEEEVAMMLNETREALKTERAEAIAKQKPALKTRYQKIVTEGETARVSLEKAGQKNLAKATKYVADNLVA